MASKVITSLTLGLLAFAVALGIASVVLNAIILNKENDTNKKCGQTSAPTYTVSKEPGFQDAATYLLSGLDTSIDPCEDFYSYACNKYLANAPEPPEGERIGTYDETQSIVDVAIANYLLDPANLQNPTVTIQILSQVFNSCLSLNALEAYDKTAAIYTVMTDLFNGFPMLEAAWDEAAMTDEKLWTAIAKLELLYLRPTLFQSYATVDYKNISRNALYINQIPLSMARDYYVRPQFMDFLDSYLQTQIDAITRFANDLHKTINSTAIQIETTEAVRLETTLAVASVPDELLRNYEQQYNAYTLAELQTAYPAIGWQAYLGTLLEGQTIANDEFIISNPSYVGELNTMLSGSQFSKRAIVNFVLAEFLSDNLAYIATAKEDAYAKLLEVLRSGTEKNNRHRRINKPKPRPKPLYATATDLPAGAESCADLTVNYLPYASGYAYMLTFAPEVRDKIVNDVTMQTQFVIDQFLLMMKTLDWMTADAQQKAKTKSDGLHKNVGFPWWFNDSNMVDAYHEQYKTVLGVADWWKLLSEVEHAYQITENFGLLSKPSDRDFFLMSPALVNAWYQPERNSITFPMAAFNPPYYRVDFPQAYNYAGQGGTAGHELTHGYDDEGVQFGPTGALDPCEWNHCGWMDKNSTRGFTDMAQCVVSQFSHECCPLTTGNVHYCTSGERTQGENIADLGGQRAAYKAYRNYVAQERNGVEEDRLPGLEEYTPNQIFWLTYGFSWCMKYSTESLRRQLMTNPHSPGMCRVNQVMEDIPEFGIDFGCKRGAATLYPTDRCHVWTSE